MRVGLIIYGSLDSVSGGYLYDRQLVNYLRARGDSVEIVSLPWRNYAAHLADNLHVRLPRQVDVLIQDELNHPSLVFANRGRHPYPVISLVHHLRSSELRPAWQNRLYQFVERRYLQSVDGFIFNSRTTEGAVKGLMKVTKPSIIAPPPTDRFGAPMPPAEIVERSGREEFRILFLGNVIHRKGLHTLLEAVCPPSGAFRIDVVGSPDAEPGYMKKVQGIIARRRLSSVVFFHGALDREPLTAILRAAHVLAVPSSYEGFGIVYLEGMCFGLPAIGTTAGAASEVIRHGQDGFLIQPESVQELADVLRLLRERRDVLLQLSLAARERYLRQPAWEQTAGRIREFLWKQVQAFSV